MDEIEIFPAKNFYGEYVGKKYGVKYAVAGMTSWMKSHEFSFIKPHSVPAKADSLQQAKFVEKYQSLKVNTPAEEPIIFLDAVHPAMATKETYGWIRKGNTEADKINSLQGKNEHHRFPKSESYACRNRRL